MKCAVLDTRFNDECVSLLSNMPAVFAKSLDESGVSVSADMFHFTIHKLVYTVQYGTPDYKDVNVSTLGEVISLIHKLQHDTVYKIFYKLLVVLLTVPVTSASCERCHSKVVFVKSAVRASMASHCLSDLVMISCEKSIIDGMDLSHVVDRIVLVRVKIKVLWQGGHGEQ